MERRSVEGPCLSDMGHSSVYKGVRVRALGPQAQPEHTNLGLFRSLPGLASSGQSPNYLKGGVQMVLAKDARLLRVPRWFLRA